MDRLAAGNYLLLTTFRRSGTAVPTPVWAAREGAELFVWTAAESGKVKRIRNGGAVELRECDLRGNPKGPDAVPGTARLLDEAATEHVRDLIKAKYGVLGRITLFGSRLRRGRTGTIGIAITLD